MFNIVFSFLISNFASSKAYKNHFNLNLKNFQKIISQKKECHVDCISF